MSEMAAISDPLFTGVALIDVAPQRVCALQLHSGDYAPYADAATSAGFAFLEYDVQAGAGPLEVLVDAVEVQSARQALPRLPYISRA